MVPEKTLIARGGLVQISKHIGGLSCVKTNTYAKPFYKCDLSENNDALEIFRVMNVIATISTDNEYQSVTKKIDKLECQITTEIYSGGVIMASQPTYSCSL